MNFAFRTDASATTGSGHLMRCLTLAEHLIRRGATVRFVCAQLPANLASLLQAQRIGLLAPGGSLNQSRAFSNEINWEIDAEQTIAAIKDAGASFDWLIVDSYALAREWETRLRTIAPRIMVIDDLANRQHDCDLLLDQNLSARADAYKPLVPQNCPLLLGPSFALLRGEFAQPGNAVGRDAARSGIFVAFGGSDPTGETLKAIEAIKGCAKPHWRVDVVAGESCPSVEAIRKACGEQPGFFFRGHVDDIARLMSASCMAIGGGGVSALERCALGLPSIVIAVADNQLAACKALAAAGAIEYLGYFDAVSAADISRALLKMAGNPDYCEEMGRNGRKLVDGGGAARVAREIERVSNGIGK